MQLTDAFETRAACQIDARQPQCLGEWQKLVGIEPDAGAERSLKQCAVGRGRRAPGHRAQVCGEHLRIVRSGAPDLLPKIVFKKLGIDLGVKSYADLLALSIVIRAGQIEQFDSDDSLVAAGFHDPVAPTQSNEVAPSTFSIINQPRSVEVRTT